IALVGHALDVLHLAQHDPDDFHEVLTAAVIAGCPDLVGQLTRRQRFATVREDIRHHLTQRWLLSALSRLGRPAGLGRRGWFPTALLGCGFGLPWLGRRFLALGRRGLTGCALVLFGTVGGRGQKEAILACGASHDALALQDLEAVLDGLEGI